MWIYALDFGWCLYLNMKNVKNHPPSLKKKVEKNNTEKKLILVKMSVELNEIGVICTHEGRKKSTAGMLEVQKNIEFHT